MDPNGNCLTLQKSVTLHFVDAVSTASGANPTYFGYPSLPNVKSVYRLYGNFWNFKYFFEAQSLHSGTKIESDACQIYLHLMKSSDSSDIEFQLYCDSGPKANVGGWQLTKMKWISVKVAFINPDTKQMLPPKKLEGETRCGKLLCPCGQTKLCLRKQNFCSSEYLQPLFVINKCVKPRNGMGASFYCTIDALVTVTLFPHNPNSAPATSTNVYDIYWKSQHEASKRIFHAKIGTDLKLEVNGKEFPCHKCILAGHSEVFSRMFSNDKRNGGFQFLTRLQMENMSVVGVDSFLKYLYYGDTSFSELPASVAYELMKAGEKYHIHHLRRTSYEILFSKPLDELDCGTALKLYSSSPSSATTATYAANYASLKRIALQFFTKYYAQLVKSEEFVKLFEENREFAQEILIKIHKAK